ncbi:ROK family protein [Candidatus Mancarchaeum acidiphilum]|uniref:ROK family protein n=1 Tax=Candidatus Mancarchaeum acidiphilum TaxID=1920749 RepID=A0A218NNM0_9ARCH|nr:ROK family protein [Candidatus Mancarchaeum acidiphilum]ASI14059.1 ROK family protein [Candidatus Mancarchaeum acidiphilum]
MYYDINIVENESVLGFEVGASKTIALVGDLSGNVFSKIIADTRNEKDDKEVLFRQLKELQKKVSKKYDFNYVSMTFPGAINRKGIVAYTPNLPGWKGYNLMKGLKERFDSEVFVENDANAQAVAEKIYGYGRKYSNFIYLTVGTGIGGGIFIDDKLYSGHNGWAGEFGHMVIGEGPKCGCGRYGCLETLASGSAIKRMAFEAGKNMSGKEVFEAWFDGDKAAKAIVEKAASSFTIGIANIVNIFDPEAIIIGGGITKNNERYLGYIRKKLPKELGNYRRRIKIIRASENLIEKAPLALAAYRLNIGN